MSLHDPVLQKLFQKDREILSQTAVPIVTVTGSFKEDVKRWYGLENENLSNDVVFSRAHFSMAYGALSALWGKEIQPKNGWLVDPTNYVSTKQWRSITFTENVGELLARQPILKKIKDLIDQFGRGKLPILKSITPPLHYLFEHTHNRVLSFHIAAGNILLESGKEVVQVITDPHVRDEYLRHAQNPKLTLCVFDELTKQDALEKAHILGKKLDPKRVIVTGPPIDQRIVLARKGKKYTNDRPLRLLIATGGLGTNKSEIRQLLHQLLPTYHSRPRPYQLMLYAGTEKDFADMAKQVAKEHRIKCEVVTKLSDQHRDSSTRLKAGFQNDHHFTVLHHPQIFDANELLIHYGFPWADGVISKPSGDMAYDAVAAGCFLLTLNPWGVWEENIAEIFRQKGISRPAEVANIKKQLEALKMEHLGKSWMSYAMKNAKEIDTLFLTGTKNILEVIRA